MRGADEPWKLKRIPAQAEVVRACDWLNSAKVPYEQPTALHIKIGALNFYPTSGTLHFDRQPRLPERGLTGLRTVLQRRLRRDLPPVPEILWE